MEENVSEGRAWWETRLREMGRAGSQRAVLCVAFGFGFCGRLNKDNPEWPCPIPGTLHNKRNFANEIEDLKMGR